MGTRNVLPSNNQEVSPPFPVGMTKILVKLLSSVDKPILDVVPRRLASILLSPLGFFVGGSLAENPSSPEALLGPP